MFYWQQFESVEATPGKFSFGQATLVKYEESANVQEDSTTKIDQLMIQKKISW